MEKGDKFSCEKMIIRNNWVRRSWEKTVEDNGMGGIMVNFSRQEF